MRVRTMGALSLEGSSLKRAKPLLLLSYLAVEGAKERWLLKELFWRDARNAQSSLSTALAHLRKAGTGVLGADDVKAWIEAECDANELLVALDRNDNERAAELYGGPFLAGIDPSAAGVEVEEWIYETRETLGSRVRLALLDLAEGHASVGEFSLGAELAQRAYLLPGAPEPEPEELERLFMLLKAGEHSEAFEVRKEAAGFDLELSTSVEDARSALQKGKDTTTTAALINLPVRATRFVGREHELNEISELLTQPECRLLTLSGAGGLGKTRLALEAAQDQLGVGGFADGVAFVPLEALTAASSIPAVVADALGLTLSGQEDTGSVVRRFLAEKQLLLVLDSFEHVLEGASFVSELILNCPGLKLLITSRERLSLQGEWVFTIEGLTYPEEGTTLERAESFDAMRLFLERARCAQRGFSLTPETLPAVARICRLVGGMPLALELAASWLRALPVDDIASELEAGMDLLESSDRDVPERHRGVRAVFDYSWALLSQKEQEVLRKLSVFRGGFRREAAALVSGATLPMLARLVDTSFLSMSPEGRYDRHRLLAQYTHEKLAENPEERAEVEQKHGSYYLGLVRDLEPDLWTLKRREAFGVFLAELVNIRAAWDWAVDNLRVEEIERTTPAMFDFFTIRLTEGLEYFGTTFEFFGGIAKHLDESDPNHAGALGTLLIHQVFLAFHLNRNRDHDLERSLIERGVSLLESVDEPRALARGYHVLAQKAADSGETTQARETYQRALAVARKHRSASDIFLLLRLAQVWNLDWETDDLVKHKRFVQEALAELRALNHLPGVAQFLKYSGGTLEDEQRYEEAKVRYLEVLRLAEELGHHELVINTLKTLARASIELGEVDQAAGFAEDAHRRAEEMGLRFMVPNTLGALAQVARARGDFSGARELLLHQMELAQIEKRGEERAPVAWALSFWAELLVAEGEFGEAVALLAYLEGIRRAAWMDFPEVSQALGELEGLLSTEAFAAAVERGRGRTLEEVVRELLPEVR